MSRKDNFKNMVSTAKSNLSELKRMYDRETNECKLDNLRWDVKETEDYIKHYETLINYCE